MDKERRDTHFSAIAARYERDALVQKSAAENLLGLLNIESLDHVLDLGCGTGHLTRKIRGMTAGKVVGVDPAAGMIAEAIAQKAGLDIAFIKRGAEELDFENEFTVIFCNSALQWFRQPKLALTNCFAALKNGGRMGIQAPAGKRFCPNFRAALQAVREDPRTAKTVAAFKPPWIFLNSEAEYAELFRQAAFSVSFCRFEEVRTLHTPAEVVAIFESGAAAGYLNQEYYSVAIDEEYARLFREIVRRSFHQQANPTGMVELIFNRIYLVAEKR